jgi:hypothetical protein
VYIRVLLVWSLHIWTIGRFLHEGLVLRCIERWCSGVLTVTQTDTLDVFRSDGFAPW